MALKYNEPEAEVGREKHASEARCERICAERKGGLNEAAFGSSLYNGQLYN